jgi:hypothetical protein
VTERELVLEQPIEWLEGTHYLAIRRPNGKLSGPYVCTKRDDDFTVLLSRDLDFVPDFSGKQEPPFYMFGLAEKWCRPALITDIKPQGTDSVSVSAVNYDARVYADDDNSPPV